MGQNSAFLRPIPPPPPPSLYSMGMDLQQFIWSRRLAIAAQQQQLAAAAGAWLPPTQGTPQFPPLATAPASNGQTQLNGGPQQTQQQNGGGGRAAAENPMLPALGSTAAENGTKIGFEFTIPQLCRWLNSASNQFIGIFSFVCHCRRRCNVASTWPPASSSTIPSRFDRIGKGHSGPWWSSSIRCHSATNQFFPSER